MAKAYCTIAVETAESAVIISFLQSQLGISFKNNSSELALGLHFHVYDAPGEWLYGLDSLSHALKRHMNRATLIWEELQGFLKAFRSGDSKALRLRWLRSQKKIELVRRKLTESRRSIQELLVSLSA